MVGESIILKLKNSVAQISLNRPQKRNAINFPMSQELVEAFNLCSNNQDIKVVILRGEGSSFCSGIDVAELRSSNKVPVQKYMDEEVSFTQKLFLTMRFFNKPMIAAVHGHVLGAGLGLVALSHFTIATEDAKFGLPEINFELFPIEVMAFIFQAIGPKQALQLGLLGEQIDSSEALRIRLIDQVVPTNDLINKTWELGGKLSGKNSNTLMSGIEAYNILLRHDFWKYFDYLKLMHTRSMEFKNRNLSK